MLWGLHLSPATVHEVRIWDDLCRANYRGCVASQVLHNAWGSEIGRSYMVRVCDKEFELE